MDADQILQWHAEWKLAAARILAITIARLDAAMAELGFERDGDGGWVKRPLPVPAPRPAPVPVRVPKPRPPADRTAA